MSLLSTVEFLYFQPPENFAVIHLTTRFDVYETLCPQQMLVHKGSQTENLSGECRDIIPTKLQCQAIQGALQSPNLQREIIQKNKTRIDVYETLCPKQMLVHKGGKIKNWGGECRDVTPTKSLSQNIRVDVNREVKFL